MNRIVAAGDRAAPSGGPLRPLPAYPPREVPALAIWMGVLRSGVALPLALVFTVWTLLITIAIGVPFPWLTLATGAAAGVAWTFAARAASRARGLLERGMPAHGRIERVHVNLMVHSGGRSRTTIEYDWTPSGMARRSRTSGYLGRHERGLVRGDEIDLVYDPSAPEDHLVPLFYGFRLEPF